MSEYASLPDVARHSAERYGPRMAVARAARADGGGMTYAELWAGVERAAAYLRACGCTDGDRVLLVADPLPQWAGVLLGILHAGLVAVPLPRSTDSATIERIRVLTGARATARGASTLTGPLPLSGDGSLRPSSERPSPWRLPTRDDLALIVFTSGSTSNPRAVELTHGNLLANLESMLSVRRAGPGDAFLSMLPPSHLFEMMGGTLGPLACGARVVYPGALLPNRLVEALREERITHALAVPALLDLLFREVRGAIQAAGVVEEPPPGAGVEHAAEVLAEMTPERRAQVKDAVRATIGPSLRTLIVGGAASSPAWGDVLAGVGIRLEVGYGLTEASPIVSLGVAGETPRGSVGHPLPGVDVKSGDGGELLVRGANVMRGYFRDDEATRAALADGWLRTGDIGRVDEHGFVFVDGRIKEAMVTATGETVWPDEFESFYASSLFAEWCVVPVRGADGNDVPTLVVVIADANLTYDDVQREGARLRAAAPSRVRVANVVRLPVPLPRTATGKVRRRVLGEFLAARHGRTGSD